VNLGRFWVISCREANSSTSTFPYSQQNQTLTNDEWLPWVEAIRQKKSSCNDILWKTVYLPLLNTRRVSVIEGVQHIFMKSYHKLFGSKFDFSLTANLVRISITLSSCTSLISKVGLGGRSWTNSFDGLAGLSHEKLFDVEGKQSRGFNYSGKSTALHEDFLDALGEQIRFFSHIQFRPIHISINLLNSVSFKILRKWFWDSFSIWSIDRRIFWNL
jgi:hypothetical protein